MFNSIIISAIITSVVIVILIALQPMLHRKYTSSAIYILWICVLLRLVIPFNIKMPFVNFALDLGQIEKPVYSQVHLNTENNQRNISAEIYKNVSDNLKANLVSDKTKRGSKDFPSTGKITNNNITLINILKTIWFSVVILLFIKIMAAYILFSLKIKAHSTPVTDKAIIDYIKEIQRDMRIRRNIPVSIYKKASAPQLFGLFKPIIILPEIIEDKEMLQFVMKHELTHYKRGDLFIKISSLIVNAFYWFNPMIYLVRKNLDLYCELSCDESVVKNMNVYHRQKYGETILVLMRNSIRQNNRLSTCFYSNKKIFERRIFTIMDVKKKHKGILLIAAALFTIGILGGFTKQNELKNSITVNASISAEEKTIAAVVRNKELNLVDLKAAGNVTTLDDVGMFSHPIISPGKNYIAYLKDNTLYVSTVKGKKSKVLSNESALPYTLSYTWLDNNSLLYSTESGGIYIFNAEKEETTPYVKNEFNYHNMTVGTDKKIYAEKYRYYEKDGNKYIEDYGVALFLPDSKKEQLIIQSIPSDQENNLGMYPVIAGISKDLRFLYIWEHPHAGSMAADGMSLASYDTKSDKYIKIQNKDIITLGYKDNFSSCSKNSESLALINGIGREMNDNKTLGILNVTNGSFEKLLPQGQVAMTPYYSSDCKNILYAASEKLDGIENLSKWIGVKHPIYNINVETKQITQLTNSESGFDFAPMYINDKDIVFLRSTPNRNVSMWKLENGKETKLIDNLIFYNDEYKIQDYYGHFNSNNYVDIK